MDLYLFNLINQFAGRFVWLDKAGVFFADQFGYILVVLILVIFWKRWETIIQAFSAVILARLVVVNIIRWIFPRVRPFVENNVNLLISQNPQESSFPSGHAAFYFAVATIVYFYNKRLGILFLISSFLISISRVFVGVHWPLDIIAGAVVGIFSGWLVNKISGKLFKLKTPQ